MSVIITTGVHREAKTFWLGGVQEIFRDKFGSELSLKDDYEPEKWKWRGERTSPLEEERGKLRLRPSQSTVPMADSPPPGTERGTHVRGRAERGAGVPQPPEKPRAHALLNRHSTPGHGCQARNWDPWLPNILMFSFFPEKMEIWVSMLNPTIRKCL